jgi:hypothetical protein
LLKLSVCSTEKVPEKDTPSQGTSQRPREEEEEKEEEERGGRGRSHAH